MLEFKNLTLGYNRHPAVHNLSATIADGELVALVGPNGAGKSTLMKAILGHMAPMEGSIEFNGINKTDIAYLPQANAVDRSFPITAFQFVATGLWHESGIARHIRKTDAEWVHQALARVGLEGFEKRTLNALSGGQFQRLLFARKLMQNARLVLLDEPFTGVDEQTIEDLIRLILSINTSGATVIAVIHNLSLVQRYFPKSMLLSRELIGYGDTQSVLSEANLMAASTIGFGDDVASVVCEVHDHV
ncbi:MAG: ABC transporter ATP-binding protein [Reinekea sp.]